MNDVRDTPTTDENHLVVAIQRLQNTRQGLERCDFDDRQVAKRRAELQDQEKSLTTVVGEHLTVLLGRKVSL